MVGPAWLHTTLRLTPSDVEPNSAAVVGSGDGKKSSCGPRMLTWGIVDPVRQAAQGSPNHTRQLEPHLSYSLHRPGRFRNVDAIKTVQHGIKGCIRIVARSHAMSSEHHQKRVVPQGVNDAAQAAVDGLVHLKQRVFPKNRTECRLMLRMRRVAGSPELMPCAMGFAEIDHEEIPGTPLEDGEREVCAACCPLDQAVFKAAKLLWALPKKVAQAHRICASNLPDLLLQRRGPTGERVP